MGFKTAEDRRIYLLNRYRNKMKELRELLGGKCSQCSSTEELQFDHVNPDSKHASISRLITNSSKADVLKELTHCQLLCKQCHLKKTSTNRENCGGRKEWKLVKTTGETIYCTDLSSWCKKHNYKVHTLRDIARGRNALNCDIISVTRLN
jgi:5-methylcytosine-specific restriction endonuclease McrA